MQKTLLLLLSLAIGAGTGSAQEKPCRAAYNWEAAVTFSEEIDEPLRIELEGTSRYYDPLENAYLPADRFVEKYGTATRDSIDERCAAIERLYTEEDGDETEKAERKEEDETEFPCSRMLNRDSLTLAEAGFKYQKRTNQWTRIERGSGGFTLLMIDALFGLEPTDRPLTDAYSIVIENGREGTSSLTLSFYDKIFYDRLAEFAEREGRNLTKTDEDNRSFLRYDYGGFRFTLGRTRRSVTFHSKESGHRVAVADEFYDSFVYRIDTGIEPCSKYLERQARRKARRECRRMENALYEGR